MCVCSGRDQLHETASRMLGCRTPTWWSWGDRLSPSPRAGSKSSWWNNNPAAQRAPPSTRCCCAPTRDRPRLQHRGMRRTFPAQSETTGGTMQTLHKVKQNNTSLHLNSSVTYCCMWNVSLPSEAQADTQETGRQQDTAEISHKKTGVRGVFCETSTFNTNRILRLNKNTKRKQATCLLNWYSSELLINRSTERTQDVLWFLTHVVNSEIAH